MQKVKQLLLSTNFIVLIFVLVGLRATILGAGIGDAIAILGLCGLVGFNQWVDAKKDVALIHVNNIDAEIRKEISDIRAHMSALLIKSTIRPNVAPVSDAMTTKKFF